MRGLEVMSHQEKKFKNLPLSRVQRRYPSSPKAIPRKPNFQLQKSLEIKFKMNERSKSNLVSVNRAGTTSPNNIKLEMFVKKEKKFD